MKKKKILYGLVVVILIVLMLLGPLGSVSSRFGSDMVDLQEDLSSINIGSSETCIQIDEDVIYCVSMDTQLWNPDTGLWRDESNLLEIEKFEETIKCRTKIWNSWAGGGSVFDHCINPGPRITIRGTQLDYPTLTTYADIKWEDIDGSHIITVSDTVNLIAPLDLKFKHGATYAYYKDPEWPDENAHPLTDDIILVDNGDSFEWNFSIDESFQPNSELIIDYPIEWFWKYFYHITDVHFMDGSEFGNENRDGNLYDFVDGTMISWNKERPEFILCSGDIVDYIGPTGGNYLGYLFYSENPVGWKIFTGNFGNWNINVWDRGHTRSIPIDFCPGNHDAYVGHSVAGGMDASFTAYSQIVGPLFDVQRYRLDSSGDVVVYTLNTGIDNYGNSISHPTYIDPGYGNPILPEGTGIILESLYFLEWDLDALDGDTDNNVDNSDIIKILMIHHPFVNYYGWPDIIPGLYPSGQHTPDLPWHDPKWEDGSFLDNRLTFHNILVDYNIDLVCWGHTHMPNSGVVNSTSTQFNDAGSLRDTRTVSKIYYWTATPTSPKGVLILEICTGSQMHMNTEGKAKVDVYDEYNNHNGFDQYDELEVYIPESDYSYDIFDEIYGLDTIATEVYLDKDNAKDYRFEIEALENDDINVSIGFNLKSDFLKSHRSKDFRHINLYYEEIPMNAGDVATLNADASFAPFKMTIDDPSGPPRDVFPTRWEGEGIFFVDDDFNSVDTPGWNEICFDNIQDAIDEASEPWDIYVYSGLYEENLVIDKSISIIGQDNETAIIQGSGSDDVVHITTDGVVISGFKIKNSGPFNAGIYQDIDYIRYYNQSEISENIIESNDYGIRLNNVEETLITRNTITLNNNGIYLIGGSNNNNISENNITTNNDYGIYFESHSDDNSILDNILTGCRGESNDVGIYLTNSDNNQIKGNKITDFFHDGIAIKHGSDDNIISENNVSENRDNGINLAGTGCDGPPNYNNIISKNTILDNEEYGIDIYDSKENKILDNNISNNHEFGIFMDVNSDDNEIMGNTIANNIYEGIKITGGSFQCKYNTIYYNNFINNNLGELQVIDNGYLDRWYNHIYPYGGNYWDDHPVDHDNFTGENQDIDDWRGDYIRDENDQDGGLVPYIVREGVEDKYPLIDMFDRNKILFLDAPTEVNDDEQFMVTVTTGTGEGMPYARIDFNDDDYYTDRNGILNLTAPSVICPDGTFWINASYQNYLRDAKTIRINNDEWDNGWSCFPEGTLITLPDKSLKPIEDVKVGDVVLGYDPELRLFKKVTVLELESPIRSDYYIITFEDGSTLKITNEHPIYTIRGWASINPKITLEDSQMIVKSLVIGDKVLTQNNYWKEITQINRIDEVIQTYNLKSVSNTNTFFADGCLVHNKEETEHTPPIAYPCP